MNSTYRAPTLYASSALSFDDILLVPQHSNVASRSEPSLVTKFTRNVEIAHPLISTNMSTITESAMMLAMWESGSFGILHRFMDSLRFSAEMKTFIDTAVKFGDNIPIESAVSIGIKGEELDNKWLSFPYVRVAVVDVAHGDSKAVVGTIRKIKDAYPQIDVVAGNVATREGFKRLVDAGADGVRVGIGGGSACTTRLVTGSGVPTLASIIDCAELSYDAGVPMIADGGFRTAGDIVKALAFGASTVCIGGILAATSETPGPIIESNGNRFKEYYGMSSNRARSIKSGKQRGIAEEGIEKLIPYKGYTDEILSEILGGIRSGLSYSGALNIKELRENAEYITLSSGSMRESKFG